FKLLAQRIGLALLSLLAVSVLVFAITGVLPGDAAQEQLGQEATPESLGALVRGDLGTSSATQLPVAELIASRLPNSLLLAAVTALFSVPIALTLGIASAVWRGSWFDRAASTGAVAIVSVPEFLVATLAVLIFAVQLRWLPALSYLSDIESLGQLLRAFAMPVLTLCCVIVAQMMRMSRAAV